jgi:hypothetical protein
MLVLYLAIKVNASLKTNTMSNGGHHFHANENIQNWVPLNDPFNLMEKIKLDAQNNP